MFVSLDFNSSINIKKKKKPRKLNPEIGLLMWKNQVYTYGKNFLREGEFQSPTFNLLLNWEIQLKNFSAHIKRFFESHFASFLLKWLFPQVRNGAEQTSFAIFES